MAESAPISYGDTERCQQSLLFELPQDVLFLICKHIAIKDGAIGSPDQDGEVRPGHFLKDYRQYRSLDFAKTCRTANKIITRLFFSQNTFEFHDMYDCEVFAFYLSDEQRLHVSRMSLYCCATEPFTTTHMLIEVKNFRPISLHDHEKSLGNALMLIRSLQNLEALNIFYRSQIHSDSICHPLSKKSNGIPWIHRGTCELDLDTRPHVLASWDVALVDALPYLRGDKRSGDNNGNDHENCHFDFDNIITNELAKKIDNHPTRNPEDYKIPAARVRADCARIIEHLRSARNSPNPVNTVDTGRTWSYIYVCCGSVVCCEHVHHPWPRAKKMVCGACGRSVTLHPGLYNHEHVDVPVERRATCAGEGSYSSRLFHFIDATSEEHDTSTGSLGQ